MQLTCGKHVLTMNRTHVMGVVNVTPDSFYDGGKTDNFHAAIQRAETLLEAGATIIDIGGESTRPGGNNKLDVREELGRVIDVVAHVSTCLDAVVSIDTSNPEVMRSAVQAGASIINDVRALQRPHALEAAAACHVPVILMHSLVEQPKAGFIPEYNDIIESIKRYMKARVQRCKAAGILEENIILDPGFGGGMFGKTAQHDLLLLKRFDELHDLGFPLLAGVSRKSFIGSVLNKEASARLYGSLAAAAMLVSKGTHIIRVHDVAETVDVVKIIEAINNA